MMNEEIMTEAQEQPTEPITEPMTEAQTEENTEPVTESQTEQENESREEHQVSSNLPDMHDNDLHELFLTLGVDLDYVPTNTYEAFTMGCQLLTALLFLGFFLVYLFKLMRGFLRGNI